MGCITRLSLANLEIHRFIRRLSYWRWFLPPHIVLFNFAIRPKSKYCTHDDSYAIESKDERNQNENKEQNKTRTYFHCYKSKFKMPFFVIEILNSSAYNAKESNSFFFLLFYFSIRCNVCLYNCIELFHCVLRLRFWFTVSIIMQCLQSKTELKNFCFLSLSLSCLR